MIDIALLRDDFDGFVAKLKRRGKLDFEPDELRDKDIKRRELQRQVELLRAERNEKAREIGRVKAAGGSIETLNTKAKEINEQLQIQEKELSTYEERINDILLRIPNLVHDTTPDGAGEEDNRELRSEGNIKPLPTYVDRRDHVALGEGLGQMDFELAAKLASSRFVILSSHLARLHRALIQFMLGIHIKEHGYTEMYFPYLVNPTTLTGTGQLPKFEDDLLYAKRDNLYLIPTAEVVATNVVRDRILEADELPLKIVSHTPCFRREAGSYGKDTRGMLRQHQFEKVELVWITAPEESYDALEKMTQHAEKILQKLELPYRVVALCAGDIGFAASKTYDIEVFLPGQWNYREISSCSNCEAFQARRMKARYRTASGQTALVQTLNGSGVAIGRAMIAVMENYQRKDGGIDIPKALVPYMTG